VAEEHAGHFASIEQSLSERRCFRLFGSREIARAGGHDGLTRKKLQSRRVRSGFGLDEHTSDVGSTRAASKQCSLALLEARHSLSLHRLPAYGRRMTVSTRTLRALALFLIVVPLPLGAQADPAPAVANASLPAPRYAQPDDPWIY